MEKVHGNSLKSGKWNPSQRTQFKSVKVATERDSSGNLTNYVQSGNHGDNNTRAIKLAGKIDFDITAKDFNSCYDKLRSLQNVQMSDVDKINRITGKALERHNLNVRNWD